MAAKITRPKGLFDFLRPGESYTSLVLGIVVVIIAAVFIISFVRSRSVDTNKATQTDVSSSEDSGDSELVDGVKIVEGEKTYKIQSGDNLWKIATKVYKDGYQWIEIAKANNLTNPNFIHADNTLKLPEIKVAVVTPAVAVKEEAGETKITGATHTVKKGDNLWEIALRAYGDGFKWVEIAKANNITNPDIIFTGTELKLPR